ncbi:MAG: hypothetical protein HQK96_13170 [Nitrospirae bacterium]|nr:hypothetical protein [Nitrospirota bacterium]
MNRSVPDNVMRILREEVNYGCPYPSCGQPILMWHHFDPPWNEENHHRPEGMIALCPEHHRYADGGHYTKAQLRKWKLNPNDLPYIKQYIPWTWESFVYEIGTSYASPSSYVQVNTEKILSAKRDPNTSVFNIAPWLISLSLVDENGHTIAKIKDNYLISDNSSSIIEISYHGKNVIIKDKSETNSLELNVIQISQKELMSYLEKKYLEAFKNQTIKLLDGTIMKEVDNIEKKNQFVNDLFETLVRYINSDNKLNILDINGKINTKTYSLNYTKNEVEFPNQMKFYSQWGFSECTVINPFYHYN